MIKETTKTQEWLDALRSGVYEQDMEFLNTGAGMCCLGVLADINGVPFTYIETDDVYGVQNELGEYNVALLPTSLARQYDLDKRVTDEELAYLYDMDIVDPYFGIDEENPASRMGVLSHLNDSGMDFDGIANTIERLDW